jgi:hypothetical protein
MFLKKIIFFSLLASLAFGSAASLKAQEIDLDTVTDEQLAMEGPLTLTDIDLYLKFFTQSTQLAKETDADYKQATIDFIKDNNLTVSRLRYILEKLPIALMASMESVNQATPIKPYLKVTDDEKLLIKDNLEKILSVIKENSPHGQ